MPLTDGEIRYGVLTLARRASDGHFKVADLALVQELGEQMGLAIRVDRMFRRGCRHGATRCTPACSRENGRTSPACRSP